MSEKLAQGTGSVAGASTALPTYDAVIAQYDADKDLVASARHNHSYWRWIQGGLALVRQSPLSFDPVKEYWHLTERRLLTAFFASRFDRSYAPATALRRLAFQTFRHFQRLREDGLFGEPQLATVAAGLWPQFVDVADKALTTLPDYDEYAVLRQVWGRSLRGATLKQEFSRFLEEARAAESLGILEPAFFRRLPWFPYMGLETLDDLVAHQRFFYGYYELLATTNSYMTGGGMSFAPVIQNNPTALLLGYIERWAMGETPTETGFDVEGKTEKADRAHHATVVELYGFLNLHRLPINNSRTKETYRRLAKAEDRSVFDWLFRVGEKTRAYLESNPEAVSRFAKEFREFARNPLEQPELSIEGIRRPSVAKRYRDDTTGLVEHQLSEEMNAAALSAAEALPDLDAASAMLHLVLDASLYKRSLGVELPSPPIVPPPVVQVPKAELILPASLRAISNDALGYLRAGNHVLFAGPPGTGKTTLAQLVGHAWNRGLSAVADAIPLADAPITTVGNSAWSPFHTIGGILPESAGRFMSVPGIFVDPESRGEGDWRLRPGCIVLDEMNRADLDRCIGELYPLLSRSVERVHPAGIPGVRSICLDPRFRVVATINDATLDDVVFPISEGLARRFIRLELLGATIDDLEGFLSARPGGEGRLVAALQVISDLFQVCADERRVFQTEAGDHLPFGVGYFATLRAWVRGELELSSEFGERDTTEQARELLRTSLRSAARVRGLDSLLEKLRATEEEA